MTLPSWLVELGKIIVILAKAFWNAVNWSGDVIARHAGPSAKWFYLIVVFIVIPFILITKFIADMQRGTEAFQGGISKLFLKLLAIGIVTFLIIFVLSKI